MKPLILASEGPMSGPWVPCKGMVGVVKVTGMVDGDRVDILGGAGGLWDSGLEVAENGEYTLDMGRWNFVKAVREGDAGRVSVWAR